ncbi:hypothetical protein C463_10635 [Halorubrum californiense DSM 19288]|uniref:DUF4350 domain-containing protein n=1 Tax=Halorubrum californiense DSM 19288 TaxID=1227465 RepID=M0E4E5_9EURY|nr:MULTISPECIES: DUF4350 domain-containing protein [Halorubrum]ELZ42645.1 hypothetical protein C463_10635 [Halorubrum californiense DSM 19288]TKX71217.1 DUF4350 domain-containing protein [Halorubrum sp. GN11GM_10-3_MGM]
MELPSTPRVVLYALAVAVGLGLVVAASTTGAAFGAYNLEWDGTSDFRELADQRTDSQVLLDTAPYERGDANGSVAVVLAPTEPYGPNDSRRVREFVGAGGTLVVADDFGPYGNALLDDLGASARFDGTQLRDERHYYRAPSLPVATNVSETRYTEGVDQITINKGTAIDAGNATVVATTSPFAYLDRNGTGNLSAGDELGTYPVVTTESVGEGQVVAVGDPSLFINAMLSRPDNRAFVTAMFDAHDRALLDYSHAGEQPPLAATALRFASSTALQLGAGALGLGAVWRRAWLAGGLVDAVRRSVSSVFPPGWRRRLPAWLRGTRSDDEPVDEEAILAALRERYPEWDESRLRHVMTDVLSERTRGNADE